MTKSGLSASPLRFMTVRARRTIRTTLRGSAENGLSATMSALATAPSRYSFASDVQELAVRPASTTLARGSARLTAARVIRSSVAYCARPGCTVQKRGPFGSFHTCQARTGSGRRSGRWRQKPPPGP